jgi:hypothetical protein
VTARGVVEAGGAVFARGTPAPGVLGTRLGDDTVDCTECKWWNTLDRNCLLGRDATQCGGRPVRRGDEELADRILQLQDDQREDFRRRSRQGAHGPREVTVHKNPEWE